MKDRMNSIIISTCCCLWITMVQVLDGKPYAGKRLSYEGMDWSFGGWTPLDGGGGGFTGISPIAHHPSLTQHFSSSSSSPSLGLLNSNDPSSVMDSDMIQFLKQVPSSVTPPPELHGLDPQTQSHHPKTQSQQSQQPHQQQSSSIVSQVNDSPPSPLRALRFIQQQSPSQPVGSSSSSASSSSSSASSPSPSASSSWPSLSQQPVNSNNNHNNVSGILASISSSISSLLSPPAPASSSLSYAVAPNKIRVEPKPLRQAQIEAYRVIEQLESDAEKQKQVLSAQGPTYLPLDIPSSSEESYNSQEQAVSYNSQGQSASYNSQGQSASYNSQGQAVSYNVAPSQRDSRRKSTTGYSNGNSYNSQRQTENHQTLAIPIKDIGKDYVTLPVAVETDEDKVLTPQEINEIEKEVLKAIPESLGNPDMVYESAIPLDELSSPGQYMMAQDAPNSYGGEKTSSYGGEKTNSGGNRWPKIPKFMSALSPSKVKISDLLRPLLRKVRPGQLPPSSGHQLPPSPGHQLHGMSAAPGYGGSKGSSNAPMIPGGAPYSNTGHRPENLDVIHLIAGPQANSYQPAVIHVSQLVRHKNRPSGGKMKQKKMRNKKKSNLNKPGFNPYPGFEGAASPPMPSGHSSSYQSSPFGGNGGNGNPFSQGLNPYPSGGMRPSVPASGPSYGQQHSSGIKGGGIKGGGMTSMYQVVNGNQEESYEINHGSSQSNNGNNYNTQQGQVMTGYSGPSTGNNNYEEMISISLPPNPPPGSYGQAYSELSHMPPAPFQHVNQRPHQPAPHHSSPSQSYGSPSSPSGNQNEYIEVINLPPRGGQSVEYNPGSSPSGNYNPGSSPSGNYNPGSSPSGNYNPGSSGNNYNSGHNGNQQSANSYLDPQSQGQSGGYSGNQGGYSGNQGGEGGQSYSAASSLPSYGDQSSNNNNPSYETSSQNSGPSSSPSSYGNGNGAAGATIELIDGSTSPNFNYKSVTSLDPKELVELIAKQVPALKDVLTPGHSNDEQGSSNSGYSNGNQGSQNSGYQGSQNSGYQGPQNSGYQGSQNSGYQGPQSGSGQDVSYEVIQMPPIYHNKEEIPPPSHQEASYSPAVNYAGGKGQESGESSYEGGGQSGASGGGNNYPLSNGYTQESSYSPSSQSSQSSSEQSPYQPPYESPSTYDQQNMKSPSVQYSNIGHSQSGYDSNNNNNNYENNNYENNNNNQYLSDESQRSNVIASQGSSSVQLPSSSSHSSSAPSSSSSYKFGQRLASSTSELSSSLSSSSSEESSSQRPSSASSGSSSSSSSQSGSDSVLSQLYSNGENGGRVKVSPVKVLTKGSEDDEFKEDSNLAGILLSESALPSSLPSSSSSSSSNSEPETQSEEYVAKSRK